MKRYREFMSQGECLLNALLSCIIPVLLILFCWLAWKDIPSPCQGLLILLMYMGRVGILSFSIAFITGNRHPAKIKYPEMNVMIG